MGTQTNISRLNQASNVLGASKTDVQLYDLAKDFNSYLNLDSEPLLFALLKKGMPANISAIFALSEKSIQKKIDRAIEQKIIPDSMDIEFQLFMLNNRITNYILENFEDFFEGIDDTEIEDFAGDTDEPKYRIPLYRKLIEYAYQDKIIDEQFYEDLFDVDSPPIATLTGTNKSITKEKLRSFLNYADVCYGNNLFINTCVVGSSLEHFDHLLIKSKAEVAALITGATNTNDILMADCLPEDIRLHEFYANHSDPTIRDAKIAEAVDAYADYVYKEKESRFATRCLMLRLRQYIEDSDPAKNLSAAFGTVTVNSNEVTKFSYFKDQLVDFCNNESINYFMDATVNGKTFNIETDIIRDFIDKFVDETVAGDQTYYNNNPEEINTIIENFLGFDPGFSKDDFINIFTVIQRLYYMVKENRFEVIIELLLKGYRSAYDIVKVGKINFWKSFAEEELDFNTCMKVYNVAEIKVNKVLALLNKYSQPSNGLNPAVVKPKSTQNGETPYISVMKMPELETLFGNQDITDTKHCESVLGPAAYLVDLLNLFKEIEVDPDNVEGKTTLFEKLKERRPDIEQIPLNCKNALTLVPYIDLVIEILEYHAAEIGGLTIEQITDLGWDTQSDEDDLKAEPDYCHYSIYDNVITNYSWKQPPFDLKNEEMRLYTKAMNLSRAKWSEIIKSSYSDQSSYPANLINPYFEILNLNKKDLDFFSKDITFVTDPAPVQGISDLLAKVIAPEMITETDDTSPIGTMKRVMIKSFLNLTDLNLTEFKALLDSYYINPFVIPEFSDIGYRYTIHFTKKVELQNAYLEFLTAIQAKSFIYTMYQFRRMQQATGWDATLLDNILMNVKQDISASYVAPATVTRSGNEITSITYGELLNCNNVLREEHVEKIGKVKQLQNDYKISDNQLASIFGRIRIYEYENSESYLHWLFIDNNYSQDFKDAITDILNETYTPSYVNASIFNDDGTFHPFMQYVCNVLQIKEEEVRELEGFLSEINDRPVINRENIVALIRLNELLNILNISIKELNAYRRLFNNNIAVIAWFDLSNIDHIAQLFADVQLFREQEFTFEKALYFVTGEQLEDSAIALPSDDELNEAAKRIVSYAADNKSLSSLDKDNSTVREQILNELVALEPIDIDVATTIADNYSDTNFGTDKDFIDNILSIISAQQITDRQIKLATKYLVENIGDTHANLTTALKEEYKAQIKKLFIDESFTIAEAEEVLNKLLAIKASYIEYLDDPDDIVNSNSQPDATAKAIITSNFETLEEYFLDLPYMSRAMTTSEINTMAEELRVLTGTATFGVDETNPFTFIVNKYNAINQEFSNNVETTTVKTYVLTAAERQNLMIYLATIPNTFEKIESSIIENAIADLTRIADIDDDGLLKLIVEQHLSDIGAFGTETGNQTALTSYFTSFQYKDAQFTQTEVDKVIEELAVVTGNSTDNTILTNLVTSYNTCCDNFFDSDAFTVGVNSKQQQLIGEFFGKQVISDIALTELGKKMLVEDMIQAEIDRVNDITLAENERINRLLSIDPNFILGAVEANINPAPEIDINTYYADNKAPDAAEIAINSYLMDASDIIAKGRTIVKEKLATYADLSSTKSEDLLAEIFSQRDVFITAVETNLSDDPEIAIKNYFNNKPFLVDEAINANDAITVSKLAEIASISQTNSALTDIADKIIAKKGPGEGTVIKLLRDSAKIDEVKDAMPVILTAFRFANAFGITTDNALDFATNQVPFDIYNIASASVNFQTFRLHATLLQSAPYMIHPENAFSFYKALSDFISANDNESAFCKYFKWADAVENPADLAELNIPATDTVENRTLLIQWFIQLGILNELTIKPTDAVEWLKWDGIIEDDINKLKSIAKAKLGKGTYNIRVTELRDELRIKQRDALVNYIIKEQDGLYDVNDLFSYFLIDTQMTPAVSTSRIVQSTLAIQLLIQRIQFNLEENVNLSKSDENRWKWMSLYRVWEANRKIFLYPENWLEPELRDDKSPFFNELEKELTSNEINKESVEKAYHDYLQKVEKVANIEYCQMFNEEYEDYSVLHVVGRTKGIPNEYYYRKLVNESYWTPWEPMGIDIITEHIMPVVINDRLMVFWLEYTDEVQEPENISFEGNSENKYTGSMPIKQLKVKICWSEYKKGEWSEKKMYANDIILIGNGRQYVTKSAIRLFSEIGEDNHIYLLHSYVNDPKNPNEPVNFDNPYGYKFKVETYNNVELLLDKESPETFNGDSKAIWLPNDMSNSYQKVRVNDDDGIVSLYIASQKDGVPKNKQMLDVGNDAPISLVYPHHYTNFCSQSPFVVEQGRRSLLFVPVVKPVVKNSADGKVMGIVNGLVSEYNGTIVNQTSQTAPEEYTEENQGQVINCNGEVTVYEQTEEYEPLPELPKHKSNLAVFLGYHPYVGVMRRNLERFGVEGLLDPSGFNAIEGNLELLQARQKNEYFLKQYELNKELVINGLYETDGNGDPLTDGEVFLKEKFEFNTRGAYGIYNWELFYHIPYMIANHFYIEGNYDEALKWMHYIFDPRETEGIIEGQDDSHANFWKFKPFAEHNATTGIEDILFDTNMHGDASPESNELDDQLEIWSNDPFRPHNVARMRIGAYMKATVMRYIDILVARGDKSFRVDTMESINEALQYYIIAAQILGGKPEILDTSILEAKPYAEFNSGAMGNAVEYMEESVIKPENAAYLEKFVESNELEVSSKPFSKEKNMKNMVRDLYSKLQATEKVYKLYFGIPKNDKMFGYWELVGDRLFKIRNSMNIDGIKRSLSLFAPPIDPGMLAAAAAAGLDIKALVNGQAGPATQYRFSVLLNQALQLCGELKSLGSQLLSAYEKEDGEIISKLRAKHEILLSEKVTRIREKGIEEIGIQLEQFDKQKAIIDFRKNFYESRESRIKKEQQQLDFMDVAMVSQVAASLLQAGTGILALFPDVSAGIAGVFGSPTFELITGGSKAAQSSSAFVHALNILATIANHKSSRAGILAGHERREEEWQFQANMAELDYAPLEKQKQATELRKEIAKYELDNHKKQIKQSKEAYDVMSTKYSNEELYNWMRKEIVQLQRNAYDMTYKLAKQAEKAYDFELNPGGFSKFISASHFDTKYEGMFAGEKLFQELKEMELAYYENNKRKYELTKHVSLALLDPRQIIDLRNTGSCEIKLPEILFDMDHPGHCNRRIKSVSVTIPCVSGPYTSVSAELTLLSNQFKAKGFTEPIQGQPMITNMATSTAVNDSGMFQLNFNDERYLPFEGAGVDSHWALALPNSVRQFDYNTINDVVLTIQYTAENSGDRLQVEKDLMALLEKAIEGTDQSFAVFVDLKSQYPEAFEQVVSGTDATITLKNDLLPGFLKSKNVTIPSIVVYEDNEPKVTVDGAGTINAPENTPDPIVSTETIINGVSSNPENIILVVQLSIQ